MPWMLNKEDDALNKEDDALNKDVLNKEDDALNKEDDTLNTYQPPPIARQVLVSNKKYNDPMRYTIEFIIYALFFNKLYISFFIY